jgi:ubiquinone biosynthesis protein UbiJ
MDWGAVAGAVALTTILWPIMRALGRRLEGKATASPALRAEMQQVHSEMEQLSTRMGEVDALQDRVAELEERLDFTERMLAQSREPNRLQR